MEHYSPSPLSGELAARLVVPPRPRASPAPLSRLLAPSPVAIFLVGAALAGAAILACVAAVHDGDPTGPFLVGTQRAAVPGVWPLSVRPADTVDGYDGQFYLVLAIDPLLRTPLVQILDDPGYRSKRILWSAAAWALSAGQARAAPIVLMLLLVAAVGWGGAVVAAWARRHGRSSYWGLAFALNLGTMVCCWRMLGDAVMVALLLTAVFAARSIERSPHDAPLLLLALAVLQKETALLGSPAVLPAEGRSRLPKLTPVRALALLSVAGWWLYIGWRTPGEGTFSLAIVFDWPYKGWVAAVAASLASDAGAFAMFRKLAFLGLFLSVIVLGLSIGISELRNARGTGRIPGLGLSILMYALMGLCLSERVWTASAYSRALLPLASLQLLYGLEPGSGDSDSIERPLARALAAVGALAGLAFVAKNLLYLTP